jgi:hypothetical protein
MTVLILPLSLAWWTIKQTPLDYAVLSNGVNECYSRSIILSKKRIVEFLNLNSSKAGSFQVDEKQ